MSSLSLAKTKMEDGSLSLSPSKTKMVMTWLGYSVGMCYKRMGLCPVGAIGNGVLWVRQGRWCLWSFVGSTRMGLVFGFVKFWLLAGCSELKSTVIGFVLKGFLNSKIGYLV